MGALETAIVYAVLGAVVAAALWLQPHNRPRPWSLLLYILCWPLFAPVLFSAEGRAEQRAGEPTQARSSFRDRIAHAEQLLDAKLAQLTGAAGATLHHETGRIRQLQAALNAMATRLADMDAVLTTPEFDEASARTRLEQRSASATSANDPSVASLAARLASIQELKQLRERHLVELERALYRIEEMSSRLAVLRFTEGDSRGADALIDEISGTIDDITEAILAVG